MFLETIESAGLAHLSYLIGDESAGEGAVIDPRRDVEVYLELAREHQVRITHILETHIHADFVSGSRELAARTGAPIRVGESEEYGFEHEPLREGDTLELGGVSLRVLHTPGHTPEHVCFLVSGGTGAEEPWGFLTGDTLFAGEVGRPDLIGGGTEEDLARQLYHSLHEKLLPLGDELVIYPAHGKGSPCGASIGDRKTSTLGYERRHNRRLRIEDREEFVREVLSSAPPAPFYYSRVKRINAAGPRVLGGPPAVQPLDAERFREEAEREDTVVVDTREIVAWGGAHIEGSLNIALRKAFPIWVGWLLDPQKRILLVLEDPRDIIEAQRQLLRVGYEEVAGYLRQGMRAWIEAGHPFESTPQLSVHALKARIEKEDDELQVLDVRSDSEWEQGHIPSALHIYAPFLPERLGALDRNRPIATYCGSGYRSSMAASLLERSGFRRVYNIPGSMSAWKAAGYPLEGAADGQSD